MKKFILLFILLSISHKVNSQFNIGGVIKDEDAFVELKVYDLLGKEIAELVKETQNIGIHSIKFNSKGLSSGIYFYEIKVTNDLSGVVFTETKKLVITK